MAKPVQHRTMSVREFLRKGYQEPGGPVVVVAPGDIAGVWYPGRSGISLTFTGLHAVTPITAAPVARAADGGKTNGASPPPAQPEAPAQEQSPAVLQAAQAAVQPARGGQAQRPAPTGRRKLPDLTKRA